MLVYAAVILLGLDHSTLPANDKAFPAVCTVSYFHVRCIACLVVVRYVLYTVHATCLSYMYMISLMMIHQNHHRVAIGEWARLPRRWRCHFHTVEFSAWTRKRIPTRLWDCETVRPGDCETVRLWDHETRRPCLSICICQVHSEDKHNSIHRGAHTYE